MKTKIRPGVHVYLLEHQSAIINQWSDPESHRMVSRQDIASAFSATILEVGLFLQEVLGTRYKEIIRMKRQKFFGRIGKERRKVRVERKGLEQGTINEIALAKSRRLLSTRCMGDMDEDELDLISLRLQERMRNRTNTKKNYRMRFSDE